MRPALSIGLLTVAFSLAIGCSKNASTTGSDPSKTGIEGGWTLTSVEVGGKKVPDAEFAKLPAEERKFSATSDKLNTTADGKPLAISYKLNPATTPPEVELTKTGADGKPSTLYGIYKLEGDLLTICAAESDKSADRPKEFKSTPENKAIIMVLKKD